MNGPKLDPNLLNLVWPAAIKHATFPIICADGAANLLYEVCDETCTKQSERMPSHIVGDLDSVKSAVLQHYELKGTKVVKDSDENINDFQKSLRILQKIGTKNGHPVVVIGGHHGRFDQTLGNLNTLYSEAEAGRCLWWLDSCNSSMMLPTGSHHIGIHATLEGPTCGLVPVGHPVSAVSTQGLRWNLDNKSMNFGIDGLVSTSNYIIESTVQVKISHPLLWTAELNLKHV